MDQRNESDGLESCLWRKKKSQRWLCWWTKKIREVPQTKSTT